MRENGSFAVFELVNFSFIPFILAQNDLRLAASFSFFGFGAGAFRLPSCILLYDALPFAFNPPFGFFPSLRCHASLIV